MIKINIDKWAIAFILTLVFAIQPTASAESLTPANYGNYCPAGFTTNPPKDFHSNEALALAPIKSSELHRIVCERRDKITMEVNAVWNLYFCEDLNINNYATAEFYVAPSPWFLFHPNYKRAEFLLFPKYPKWIRHKQLVDGQLQEVMTLHFMHSFQSEMMIEFNNNRKGQKTTVQPGARSTLAIQFDNIKLQPKEDPISCVLAED